MSVQFLLPVLTLSHTARDAKKVFKYFEEMLELDIPRQGWAYSAVRRKEGQGRRLCRCVKISFGAVVIVAKSWDGQVCHSNGSIYVPKGCEIRSTSGA